MARQSDSLARVYAKSLYELAEQAGGRDKIVEVGDELEQVVELARSERTLDEFMRSPIVKKADRMSVINQLFSDRVTDLTLRFLLVLNDKGRLGHLDAITSAFDQLVQEAFGRVEVDVFTPTALSADQRDRIRDSVQNALGKEPVVYAYTDPGMIGGIKLRIGDQLVDGSVATRLRRMRDQILGSGPATLAERLDELVDGAEA